MKKRISVSLITTYLFISIQSCSTSSPYEDISSENENETNISAMGSNKSHNMGQNCMNCHNSGGEGEGIFKVAGTVYNEAQTGTFPNATIKLFTGPDGTGTLKYTIAVDGKGNFYTTQPIDFSAELYPAVSNGNNTIYMGSSITSGQCNNCHTGTDTSRIWIN